MQVNATTAMLPGLPLLPALAELHTSLREPLWDVTCAHLQICPQTPTTLTEAVCEDVCATYPSTRFRTHANARCLPSLYMLDIARYDVHTRGYFVALADRAKRLNADAVSLHAGYKSHGTLQQMVDRLGRIQEIFGTIRVAVEGLFPNTHRPQLVDCWADYEFLLRASVPIAVDLSHLHIVATSEGCRNEDLVGALVTSPHTLELHVSGNDGCRDHHAIAADPPWWRPILERGIGPSAIVFSEGNHIRNRAAP